MEFIQLEQQDGVALLKLNRGVINALNLQVLQEVGEALQGVKDDPQVCGLVLTSANDKFFSIGFDLPELFPLPPQEFAAFFRAYNLLCLDLYTFPKPTATALTGHATAGGCILALCIDYRFMAEGRRLMGVNEIRLGVPITYLADCILRQLLGERQAREVVYFGELYPPQEALQMGMVDQVFPLEEVVSAAVKKVKDLGEMPLDALALDKRLRVRAIEAQVLSYLEEEERLFLEQWYSPEARQQLKEAIEKFVPKE
ncbi:MAG: enoyl-CoA hydratase/isomerase family protein [Deltaproteobacteria bacterium]|nr:enoyl-CoA hydratase/isomerase family protein [Deltaproteobacteria bacterium]